MNSPGKTQDLGLEGLFWVYNQARDGHSQDLLP